MTQRPLPDASPALHSDAVIADIEALLATEIFSSAESHGPLFRAAYVWLILNVHDLLQDLDRTGARVVHVAESDEDITDLIARARYAIVHSAGGAKKRGSGSPKRFIVTIGADSGHADDIAIETGSARVLVRRHAVRAFEAARDALARAASPA